MTDEEKEKQRIIDEWSKDPVICRYLYLINDNRVIQYQTLFEQEIVKEWLQLISHEKVIEFWKALNSVKNDDDEILKSDQIG